MGDQADYSSYPELMDLLTASWQDIPFTENHNKQLQQNLLRLSEKDV